MLSCLVHVFEDKRSTTVVVVLWLFVVILLSVEFGLHNSAFMHVGPSARTLFMMVPIDTWYKWRIVAALSFFTTGVNVFLSDSLEPWITNVIQDSKCKTIPYSKTMCQFIVLVWALYCNVMSTLYMFIALTQVDFLCIRIVAEITVLVFTNYRFLRDKKQNCATGCLCDTVKFDPLNNMDELTIDDLVVS